MNLSTFSETSIAIAIGIRISNVKKNNMYRIYGLFGNGYRIGILTKSYLTVKGILLHSLK